jgi:hypothetical protein
MTVQGTYVKPTLVSHGSVASLTLGKPGSDVDGGSGMQGNRSNSDNTGGGNNAGGMMTMP